MPFVLESTAYSIGYVIGQVIGFGLFLAIPAGIGYVIYRSTRKKPATSVQPPAGSAQAATQSERRQCSNCRSYGPANEGYCRNCGQELQPIP